MDCDIKLDIADMSFEDNFFDVITVIMFYKMLNMTEKQLMNYLEL